MDSITPMTPEATEAQTLLERLERLPRPTFHLKLGALLGGGLLLDGLDTVMIAIVLTAIMATFHLNQAVAGLLIGAGYLGQALGAPIIGSLAEQYGTVPDLFLDFREALQDGRQRRTPILIEHDKGTESEEVICRKIHAYSAMITSGWHKTRYGVNSITITFTTFEGERRRDKLREWARQELEDEPKDLRQCFLFTNQPQPPDPKHLWLSPCWHTCHMEDKPVAILGGE